MKRMLIPVALTAFILAGCIEAQNERTTFVWFFVPNGTPYVVGARELDTMVDGARQGMSALYDGLHVGVSSMQVKVTNALLAIGTRAFSGVSQAFEVFTGSLPERL